MTNLRALVKYVEHPGWPDLGRLPSASPKKRNPVKARGDANNDNALRRQMIQDGSLSPPDQIEEDEDAPVPALVRLTEWANAVIQYARLLAEEGGPSPTMNRKSSDFERYVFVCRPRGRRRRRRRHGRRGGRRRRRCRRRCCQDALLPFLLPSSSSSVHVVR